MGFPLDITRFSSEIVTGALVFVATRMPAGWRWAVARLRPNADFPELRVWIRGGQLRVDSPDSGDFTLRIGFINHSGRRLQIEQFQVHSWTFDGAQMPQAEVQCSPPRLVLARHTDLDMSVAMRLHRSDIATIRASAVAAPNLKSNPGHHSHVALVFVVAQRLAKTVVGPRYYDLRCIEGMIPLDDAQSPQALSPVSSQGHG